MGAREKIGTRLNPWVVAWAIGAVIFALVVVWQNRGLTFFWDEWDIVWASIESPYYGILQDNGGNFFPLSRIVFALEMAIFGTWYPAYMLVTSLLFGATAFTFNVLLDDGTRVRRITLSAFALIYLSSTGVLFASSMGFMLKWGLSPLLAIISAAFFVRSSDQNRSRIQMLALAWLFFFLSWAAFSSSIVLMALLIIGLIHAAPRGVGRLNSIDLKIKLSILILIASMAAVVVGIRLAELNPPLNPLIGDAQGTIDSVLAIDLLQTLLLALATSLAGLVSITIAVPLHDNSVFTWLIIAFRDYLGVALAVLALVLGVIYALRKSWPSKHLVFSFLLLFTANLFITAARTPLIHRYQALWVLIAIIVLIFLLQWLATVRLVALRNLLLGIVVVASCLSVWQIATGSLAVGNIERQRDLADSAKLTNPMQCLAEATRTLEQVAPTITPNQLCVLLGVVDSRSWITERQDIPQRS